jgi:hypothetical protein
MSHSQDLVMHFTIVLSYFISFVSHSTDLVSHFAIVLIHFVKSLKSLSRFYQPFFRMTTAGLTARSRGTWAGGGSSEGMRLDHARAWLDRTRAWLGRARGCWMARSVGWTGGSR